MVISVEPDPPIVEEGWAIQRVGPWVLGTWNVPLTEERVVACARLYRQAHREHGRFSVFTRHYTNPFPLEVLAGERSRERVFSLLREFDEQFGVFVVGIEGTGFQASLMRLGAAAVVHRMRRVMPIVFVSSLSEGLQEARTRGAVHGVAPEILHVHLRDLEERVFGSGLTQPSRS